MRITPGLAGILPALIQAPIVGLIYAVFLRTTVADHPNDLLNEHVLGVPLGTSFVHSLGQFSAETALVFGILLALMAAVAEVTRRAFHPPLPPDPDASPLASAGVQRALGFLPYLSVVFAAFVPLAAALYLAVTVTWTLGQRWVLRRRYPLE